MPTLKMINAEGKLITIRFRSIADANYAAMHLQRMHKAAMDQLPPPPR